jgi:hypothetical protein
MSLVNTNDDKEIRKKAKNMTVEQIFHKIQQLETEIARDNREMRENQAKLAAGYAKVAELEEKLLNFSSKSEKK